MNFPGRIRRRKTITLAFAFLCEDKKVEKQKSVLKCTQAIKMIPAFINGTMRYKELEQFMEHIETCESCKEELSIQFLVSVGLFSLEAGDTFDLQEELDAAMERAYRRVRVHSFLRQSAIILEIIGLAALITVAVMLFLM